MLIVHLLLKMESWRTGQWASSSTNVKAAPVKKIPRIIQKIIKERSMVSQIQCCWRLTAQTINPWIFNNSRFHELLFFIASETCLWLQVNQFLGSASVKFLCIQLQVQRFDKIHQDVSHRTVIQGNLTSFNRCSEANAALSNVWKDMVSL